MIWGRSGDFDPASAINPYYLRCGWLEISNQNRNRYAVHADGTFHIGLSNELGDHAYTHKPDKSLTKDKKMPVGWAIAKRLGESQR
jgi:hypothetical protein